MGCMREGPTGQSCAAASEGPWAWLLWARVGNGLVTPGRVAPGRRQLVCSGGELCPEEGRLSGDSPGQGWVAPSLQ